MNNTTPIKALAAAVLLTFGFGLAAHAAPVNKGASEMNHEQRFQIRCQPPTGHPVDCGIDGQQPDG
jgi:hypothetical protein